MNRKSWGQNQLVTSVRSHSVTRVCPITIQTRYMTDARVTARFYKRGSIRDTFSFPFLLFKLAFSNPVPMHVQFHYICWALSSSTDSSSSFIWLLSSSSWEFGSSGSSRALLPCDALSEPVAAAGLGLASVLAVAGLWSDVEWDKVFVEGCEEKKRESN